MTEITDKVAEAMVNRFKDGIAKSAGKPFEETGVHLPNEFVWEAYAFAAVRATIEHLRDNVTDAMIAEYKKTFIKEINTAIDAGGSSDTNTVFAASGVGISSALSQALSEFDTHSKSTKKKRDAAERERA